MFCVPAPPCLFHPLLPFLRAENSTNPYSMLFFLFFRRATVIVSSFPATLPCMFRLGLLLFARSYENKAKFMTFRHIYVPCTRRLFHRSRTSGKRNRRVNKKKRDSPTVFHLPSLFYPFPANVSFRPLDATGFIVRFRFNNRISPRSLPFHLIFSVRNRYTDKYRSIRCTFGDVTIT